MGLVSSQLSTTRSRHLPDTRTDRELVDVILGNDRGAAEAAWVEVIRRYKSSGSTGSVNFATGVKSERWRGVRGGTSTDRDDPIHEVEAITTSVARVG
jgi:hypothetical protein